MLLNKSVELPMSKRIHYFDNLKSAVILLIVAFHCAMSFMKYAPGWWYVINSQSGLPFTWFVIWADNFIMPLMFFISGYFGIKSLRRWKPAEFWRLKFHRVGLPWLLGMMFFVPYMIWLWFFSRDIPIGFHALIVNQYFGQFYQQGVYWYLSALMALYLLLFCAARIFPGCFRLQESGKRRSAALILAIYLVVTAIPMFLLNLFWADTVWLNIGYVLMLQITRAPVYVASFFMGAYCERDGLLIAPQNATSPLSKMLPGIFIIASCLFVWFRMSHPLEGAWDLFINALIHCSFCVISLVTALWIFRAYFNFTNRFLGQLAGMSYAIYFIHQNVGQTVILYMRPLQIGMYGKYAISLLVTLLACYAICRFLRPILDGRISLFRVRT